MHRISLAMIVRDAASTLGACLESASGWVDEMVVADTGSADGTPELARQFGARVFEIDWNDDFAAARNLVLRQTSGDWILVLDADEILQVENASRWRRQLSGGADAFQVTIRNYVHSLDHRVWDRPARPNDGACGRAAGLPGFVEHQNVRLFRRHPELYFVGRVHESVGPRVLAAGMRLAEAHGRIHHFGMVLPPATVAAKNRYYRELGRRKVIERPLDAQAHFELGLVHLDNFHAYGEAIQCFAEACRLRPDFGLAWFFAGVALTRMGHHDAALQFFEQARRGGYESVLLQETEADVQYRLGRFDRAIAGYHKAAAGGVTAGLSSKRGLAEVRSGAVRAGLSRLRKAREEAPEQAEIHDRLVAAYVFLEDDPAALAALRERLRRLPRQAASYLRLAAVLAHMGRVSEAAECLLAGRDRLPENPELARACAELPGTVAATGNHLEPGLKPDCHSADTLREWKKPVVADVELPSRFPAG